MVTACIRVAALGSVLLVSGAQAQSCKSEGPWQHEHTAAKRETVTTNVEGSRATRIEVCRAAQPEAPGLDVEVVFHGSHEGRPLAAGRCVDSLSKWAVIRSTATKDQADPVTVAGTYKACREQ